MPCCGRCPFSKSLPVFMELSSLGGFFFHLFSLSVESSVVVIMLSPSRLFLASLIMYLLHRHSRDHGLSSVHLRVF